MFSRSLSGLSRAYDIYSGMAHGYVKHIPTTSFPSFAVSKHGGAMHQ